ncbi:MAG TPA: hypothetical protein VFH20_06945 [Propionibacteriaceae bacterium]|nr:hypothetical protein [Propionibacteriaceae bacterium]
MRIAHANLLRIRAAWRANTQRCSPYALSFVFVPMSGGSRVGVQALHVRPKISHAHAGSTLHVHQRQTAGGYQALYGSQRNTELLRGFALG